ncbi:MAG: hypothetical protein AABO57_24705 [Acidobacteriota bacterium]
MRKLISVIALIIFVWVVAAQSRSTIYLSTATAPTSLADELERLCKCDRQFGPPAPVLDPKVLPVDVSLKDNKTCIEGSCQPCFDCYGWQLFLTLNWPAKPSGEPDPDAYFGRPGFLGNVGWETFASVYDIFGGGQPRAWAELGSGPRTVEGTSAVIHQNLVDYRQADHNWLTDWDRNLVRFEIRVNKDEFDYIVQNQLYDQDGLYKAFTTPTGAGVDLPSGKAGGIGSIEIKAAWRIVPKDREEYFRKNYKIANVKIPPSQDDVLVALVGLHITKKTPNSPQWVWATFEHQDNVPDGPPDPSKKYNFFNPAAPSNYKPNYNDPPARRSDRRVPVQVVRASPIDSRAIEINKAVHALISAKYPDSVWRNYNLIDVQWPTMPVFNRDPKSTAALPSGKPAPIVVANITMETYMQTQKSGGAAGTSPGGADRTDPGNLPATDPNYGKSSCIGCHRLSAITPTFVGKRGSWKTDYSMIFFKAKPKMITRKTTARR